MKFISFQKKKKNTTMMNCNGTSCKINDKINNMVNNNQLFIFKKKWFARSTTKQKKWIEYCNNALPE